MREAALPSLPDSVLWSIARLLPGHEVDAAAHRTFCLLGSSWRNAYCSSRQAVTLRLGPDGAGGLPSRVLVGSGSAVTRLQVHMHAQAPLQGLVTALHHLPKLQLLDLDSDQAPSHLCAEGMEALGPALGALVHLRELNLHAMDFEWPGAAAALTAGLQRLSALQHLDLSRSKLDNSGEALAPAIQQLTQLLTLSLDITSIGSKMLAPALRHLTLLQKLSVDVGPLGQLHAAALGDALRQLGRLQELCLEWCRIEHGAALPLLAPAVGALTTLRRLRFNGDDEASSNLSTGDAAALARALAGLPGLQLLQLRHHDLDGQCAEALVPGLLGLNGLTELDLALNCLDAEAVQALAPGIAQLTRLEVLDVGHNELGAEGAMALVPALEQLSRLRRLDVSKGHMRVRGVEALAPALARLSGLTRLDLDLNDLGAVGAAVLAPGLQQLTGMRRLDLRGNGLGRGGVKALGPALARMPALQHLGLQGNQLGVRGLERVLLALGPAFPALQHLQLSDNQLGVRGMVALAPALAQMAGLRRLDLGWNTSTRRSPGAVAAAGQAAGMDMVAALAPALARLTSLTHLDLRNNGLGTQAVTALAPALPKLSGLTRLDLRHNSIGTQEAAALAPVLARLSGVQHVYLDP